MYSIVYISAAKRKFQVDDFNELLETSRLNNIQHNITGLLILKDYVILQYIEGEKKDVKQLFENIKKDSRHFEIKILEEKEIDERLFKDWSMGFKNFNNLDQHEFELIKNFDFENTETLPDMFKCFVN